MAIHTTNTLLDVADEPSRSRMRQGRSRYLSGAMRVREFGSISDPGRKFRVMIARSSRATQDAIRRRDAEVSVRRRLDIDPETER